MSLGDTYTRKLFRIRMLALRSVLQIYFLYSNLLFCKNTHMYIDKIVIISMIPKYGHWNQYKWTDKAPPWSSFTTIFISFNNILFYTLLSTLTCRFLGGCSPPPHSARGRRGGYGRPRGRGAPRGVREPRRVGLPGCSRSEAPAGQDPLGASPARWPRARCV